ncbi:MAG: hypothetical protein FH748_05275 [Balneolaceae bacterium]|nr:hypothetical protein [Balneolaceae bacterium]
MDKGKQIILWRGDEQTLWNGMQLINIGGHFSGSSVLHVFSLSPEGCIFCGDTLFIAPSKKHISVMYSYPNRIPLPRQEVKRIKERFESLSFDTLYGFWSCQNLSTKVKEIMKQSMERHLR